MKNVSLSVRRVHGVHLYSNHRAALCFTLLLGLGGVVGCGTAGEEASLPGEELARHEAAVEIGAESVEDGTSIETTNGLSTNGLSTNGLSTNGLSTNGLSTNGLSTTAFQSWFEANPSAYATLIRYVVLCAVPAGQTRTYRSPVTGILYTWQGALGLAPGWAGGAPPTIVEQQLVTACLAAHANKYGLQVPISVKGLDSTGTPIPFTLQELTTYTEKEACFFGNAFNGAGVFAANDRGALNTGESTARACGLSTSYSEFSCDPIVHVGSCSQYCTLDSTGRFYTQCTYGGVTYRPLTTQLRMEDIYRCGDGVCQFTESCGSGSSYDNCMPDCGFCP
ncbi:MAG: hypothetical protein JXB05_20915 [Myxococcaceae bacterium]|nr:hypothetical protein [Myxococcaceae bacterium]